MHFLHPNFNKILLFCEEIPLLLVAKGKTEAKYPQIHCDSPNVIVCMHMYLLDVGCSFLCRKKLTKIKTSIRKSSPPTCNITCTEDSGTAQTWKR